MRRASWLPARVILVAVLGSAAAPAAEQEQRIDRLEAELAVLRQRLDRAEAPLVQGYGVYDATVTIPADNRLDVGFESTVVKPRFEDGAEQDRHTDDLDFALKFAPRVWFALVGPGGGGIRSRYWQMDHDSAPAKADQLPLDGILALMTINAYTVDIEYVQEFHLHHWECKLSAGARYAGLMQRVTALDADDFMSKRFHGVGPTFAVETLRPIGRHGFALMGNIRGSLLVGESMWSNPSRIQDTDDIGSILEMQIGAQWTRHLPVGITLFARAAWEQQLWLGAGTFFGAASTVGNDVFGALPDDHDIAVMGLAATAGVNW